MFDDTSSLAHYSRVKEFCFDDATSAWLDSPYAFIVSSYSHDSSAGGVDYDFDTINAVMNVWATADAIHLGNPDVYGIIGLPFTGNTASSQGIWIDSDQQTDLEPGRDKTQQGDVEISCPVTCGTLNDISVRCVADDNGWTGCWDYTFTFTNTSGVEVHYVLITDPNVDRRLIWLPNPVAHGATSGPIMIQICPPQGSDECYPLHVSLADSQREECCAIDKCIPLPTCDCIECVGDVIVTGPTMNIYNYSLTFSFRNMTGETLEHMFISSEPGGSFAVLQEYTDLPSIAPNSGAVGPFKIDMGFLTPGQDYCILVSVHNENLVECCSKVICFTAPQSGGTLWCIADQNGDGVVDFFDLQTFLNYFASGDPRADCNGDGILDFFDIQSFLNAFAEGCA